MKKKIFSFLLGMFFVSIFSVNYVSAECNGIQLNTDVPFVGKCIGTTASGTGSTTQLNAFSNLMSGLMKLTMTIILVLSLLIIVYAGVLITTSGAKHENYSQGIGYIKKVAIGLVLLGSSGVILKLINPNFFT